MVDDKEGDFSTTPTQESLPLEPNGSGPQSVGQDVRSNHADVDCSTLTPCRSFKKTLCFGEGLMFLKET